MTARHRAPPACSGVRWQQRNLAHTASGRDAGARESTIPAVAVGLALAICWSPLAPAAAKDTGLIFVSNEKSNNIIVLDPKTYKVVKDIKTSRRPRDMHFSADRTKLYVACGDDDVIDIIDVAKLEVIGKLPTGPSPETFAIDETAPAHLRRQRGELDAVGHRHRPEHHRARGADRRRARGRVSSARTARSLYVTSEVGDMVHLVDTEGGHVRAGRRGRHAAAPVRGHAGRQGALGHGGAVGRGLYHRPREVRRSPARSSSCRPACARPTSRRSGSS